MINEIEKRLQEFANPEKAKLLARFFKTGKGEYGDGDIFLGITVPVERKIAREFLTLGFEEIQKLLDSKIHDKRMIALFILVDKFKKSDEKNRKEIFDFYLENTRNINKWDLVDLSSHKIVGGFLMDKNKEILYKLAKSENLWERRIAVISTFAFIRNRDFKDSLKIAELLLDDKHDLIHKAIGWMLREIGKKDEKELINFLETHYSSMPRMMLRYSIEKLDEKRRKHYLEKL